jgi:ribosomal protein L18E
LNEFVSQNEIAKIANVYPMTLRRNIRILLKMVLQNGYSIKKDVAEKLDRANLRWYD